MGRRLIDADEGMHEVGTPSNWNESRYVDFWDRKLRIGGWYRIGVRVNEGHAEMSSCTYLPDGSDDLIFVAALPVQRRTRDPGTLSDRGDRSAGDAVADDLGARSVEHAFPRAGLCLWSLGDQFGTGRRLIGHGPQC